MALAPEALEPRALLAAQLLADINQSPGGVTVNRSITDVGGIAFFPGRTDEGSFQLWKSDGTASGTASARITWPT